MRAHIEVKSKDGLKQLLVEGVPVRYGQLYGGLFFLHKYAYEPNRSLIALGRKFVAEQRRALAPKRRARLAAKRRH